MKYMSDLISTSTMRKYGAYFRDRRYPTRERISPELDPHSEEYDSSYIDHFTRTIYHPAGSCKMGAVGDKSAVVDPELR